MQLKERRLSRTCALFATPWLLTVLDQHLKVFTEENQAVQKVSDTRKYFFQFDARFIKKCSWPIPYEKTMWLTLFLIEVLSTERASGPIRLLTNTWNHQPITLQEMLWLSLEFQTPRTEETSSLTSRNKSEQAMADIAQLSTILSWFELFEFF